MKTIFHSGIAKGKLLGEGKRTKILEVQSRWKLKSQKAIICQIEENFSSGMHRYCSAEQCLHIAQNLPNGKKKKKNCSPVNDTVYRTIILFHF